MALCTSQEGANRQGGVVGAGSVCRNEVVIGDGCKVQNNVSVYDNVTLEDGVFCGPSVFLLTSITRALVDRKNEFRDTLVKRGATLEQTAP